MNAKLKTLFQSAAVAFAIAFCGLQTAGSADVSLATSPLISGLNKVVAPNIFFILDDSGSMASNYMPDGVNSNNSKNCFRNWGYNKIAYNPAITYVPPVKADGTSYANATWPNAKDDGFSTAGAPATTDLSATTTVTVTDSNTVTIPNTNPIRVTNGSGTATITHTNHGLANGESITFSGVTGTGNPAKIGGVAITNFNTRTYTITVVDANTYTFTIRSSVKATSNATGGGSAVVIKYDTQHDETRPVWFYSSYTADPTNPPDTCAADTAYTTVAPSTTATQQNFANWYSFYRTRINMMKSASGRAFVTIGDKYRVGFTAISEKSTGSSKFLNIKKFDATQKAAWYTKLYAQGASGTTPLRGAVSKAGRLYAGKLVSGNTDPVQYSCQQNFTILTTDGYWNTGTESPADTNFNTGGNFGTASSNYGPFRENNLTPVGDADHGLGHPYQDGADDTPTYVNTLADVAMYYYKTDLRPAGATGGLPDTGTTVLDVSENNVPTPGTDADIADWQHMVLFGIGLGVAGTLNYNENYLNEGSSDFSSIQRGDTSWPDPNTGGSNFTSDTVTTRIDDLWHAAVNGRGQYLSASNPDSVVSALSKTLAAISVVNAASSAAATSSLEPVDGDNFAFVAQYTTGLWYGNLQAHKFDLGTGALVGTVEWSAQEQLASKVSASSDTRTIYTFSPSGTNKIKEFLTGNLGTEKSANYFASSASNPGGKLLQYDTWSADQKTAATDDAMIAFIRGQNGNEDESTNTTKLFRDRTYPLGDFVDTSPVFVRRPPFKYADTGYAAYVTSKASRTPVVYISGNDGMLHAFKATDPADDPAAGEELWTYIPSEVVPMLYKLADAGYANNHRFYVDGPITVGDAYDSSSGTWKTILIGGLGGGGRSYFALDVSDPANPKALWEFGAASCTQCSQKDNDMGYSYGNPILTKLTGGTWVVAFASGYNNTGGDSKGRLFVVNAFTGAQLQEIITDNAVTNPDLSGIAKINNYVPNTLVDNKTQYVYGGDLGGALWRFDLNNHTSQRLGRTPGTAGDQPITVRPELALIKDSTGAPYRVIYFGTGRYLGLGDLATTSTSTTVSQAFYAVKDTGADLGSLTSVGAKLVGQTLDATPTPRTIPSPQPVDWSAQNGWYVTLPKGERVNIDLRLQLGSLVAVSNLPKDDYCSIGGKSILYVLDYKTGAAVYSDNTMAVGFPIGASLATGLTLVRLPNGKLVAVITQADTTVKPMSVRVVSGVAGNVRRLGWREIY